MIVSKQVFDLKTFGEVWIGREFTPSPAFTDMPAALAYFGNDEAKVLAALTALKTQAETKAAEDAPLSEFHTFELDADGEITDKLNGLADITPVNEKLVNDLILNIAKQHFGFAKNLGVDAKRKAKADALTFVQGQEPLKAYLTIMSQTAPATTT